MRLPVVLFVLGVSPLTAQDPVDFQGWMNQGVQAFKAARYPQAVASFQRAVQIQPDNVSGHLYLGTAYMQQYVPGAPSPENATMASMASDQFLRVLKLDSMNKLAMASLASLSLNQKKWDEAQKWYETLTAADPANADAWYSMGFIAWSKWYPAYGTARSSLGMKPEDPGPIQDVAVREKLKADYGQVVEAGIQALEKALQANPQYDDAMAYMNLLIRERADLRDTTDQYRQDIAVADEWVQKALAAKRQKAESRQGLAAPPPSPTPQRIMVGGNVQESKLVNRVSPVYSPLALQARLSGVVHLQAVIGKDGRVVDLKVIGGHPLLIPAALEAVKQWVYQPTMLNGNPVEVMTTVDVKFELP